MRLFASLLHFSHRWRFFAIVGAFYAGFCIIWTQTGGKEGQIGPGWARLARLGGRWGKISVGIQGRTDFCRHATDDLECGVARDPKKLSQGAWPAEMKHKYQVDSCIKLGDLIAFPYDSTTLQRNWSSYQGCDQMGEYGKQKHFVWNVWIAGSREMLPLACCCPLHVVAALFSELRHIRISIMIIRLIIIIMIIILISSGRCCHLHVLLPRRWCCHRWDKVTPHRHSWRDKMDSWIFYFSTFILPCKQCIWYNTFPLFCGTLHLHTLYYTQTFKLAASLLPFFRANICSYTWLNDSNTEMWICSFYLLFLICRILSPIIIYSSSI